MEKGDHMTFASKSMDLETTMLSEINQSPKPKIRSSPIHGGYTTNKQWEEKRSPLT